MKINPKLLLDVIYPVGSYYETSDTNFNPNNAWGGTWQEDTKGRVLVAYDSDDTSFDNVGEIGGSKYLETHHHTNQHYAVGTNAPGYSGWEGTIATTSGDTGVYLATANTTDAGSGNAGNLQPYIVVKRWHRTA